MYDIIIIGGGPAGLTAGLYACRGGLKTLLFEKMFTGGQAATTYMIENYPGFDEGVAGPDFAMKLENQARKFGLEIQYDTVTELQLDGKIKKIVTDKETYEAKAVILAMGANPKTLGLEKEDRLRGAGVSYCATCDGAFYRDKVVAVVGGGDTAAEDAVYLSKFVKKVYLIHRRDQLRASKVLQERALNNPKIQPVWDTVVEEILGEDGVTGVRIRNVRTGQSSELQLDGLFIAIGLIPNTELVKDKLPMSAGGYLITDDEMKTGIPGVFAAGDVRQKTLWQLVTAAADGAIAATSAERYIYEKFDSDQ